MCDDEDDVTTHQIEDRLSQAMPSLAGNVCPKRRYLQSPSPDACIRRSTRSGEVTKRTKLHHPEGIVNMQNGITESPQAGGMLPGAS